MIRLVPLPGNEYNTAWVSGLSLAVTSFNSHHQDVKVGELSLFLGNLIPPLLSEKKGIQQERRLSLKVTP